MPSPWTNEDSLESILAFSCPSLSYSEPLDMSPTTSLGIADLDSQPAEPGRCFNQGAPLAGQITDAIDITQESVEWDDASVGLADTVNPLQPLGDGKDDDWFPDDVYRMGFPNDQGTWHCSYPGCTSQVVFERACDLRKHYKSHVKLFFCNQPECIASGASFASKKDLNRHTRSHRPDIQCIEPSCNRVFSRVDNMVSSPMETQYDVSYLNGNDREIISLRCTAVVKIPCSLDHVVGGQVLIQQLGEVA